MNTDNIVTTTQDVPVDEHTHPLADFEGYQATPTARGSITAHELTTDVDGAPLGVEYAGSMTWEVGTLTR